MLDFPFFKSLLFPDLMLGVGKTAAMGVLAMTFIMCFQLMQWWFLAVSIPGLYFLSKLSKEDPYITPILTQRLKLKEVYY